jgi:hypothetical protein
VIVKPHDPNYFQSYQLRSIGWRLQRAYDWSWEAFEGV